MAFRTSKKEKGDKPKKRHRFFLNPYRDYAFAKCPVCETSTKVRKFPLVIHIDPHQLFLLNKQCRYCPECDLIIAKREEIESLMAAQLIQVNPEVVGNKYLVMGTLDKKDWREGSRAELTHREIKDRMYVFKDVWNFDVTPAG